MNPTSHGPATSRAPSWCRVLPILLGLGLGAGVPVHGGDRSIPLEDSLVRCLRQIEAAFRAGDAARLRDVLPVESRVLVGLESFSRRKGYYAPDQVVLIFRSIFERVRVEHFRLDLKRGSLTREMYYVRAIWSVRGRTSAVKDCQLQFMVRKEGTSYFIREIKEVR